MERYFTEPEQARLLAVLKAQAADAVSRRDAALIRLLIHSGLRIGEALQVTVGQALEALRSNYLFIPREHRKGWNRTADAQGKTRRPPKDHMVFVTGALRADLQDLLRVRHEQREGDCQTTDPLVIGRHGGAITVRAFELRFKLWAFAAELPLQASPHWLRHTRAMNIIRRSTAKNPLGVVQAALCHASIKSTGVYTATPREEVEAALVETDGRRRVSIRELRRSFEDMAA